jgi:hypothetical protein
MTLRLGDASRPVPRPFDWVGAALVVLAAVAFSLIRAQAVNLPWHLATARLARAVGQWPARNTFSYTFPDHPVYQQYPAFQATVYGALRLGGWGALSVVTCVGWTLALLLFARWAGPWRAGAALHTFWMLALYALWRRMMLRPDMFSMLALGIELLAFDVYARTRRPAAVLLGVPCAHLLWVNSHQLFPLSFVVQGLFVLHVLLLSSTRAFAREEPPPPLAPVLGALALSVALTFATPLGIEILWAPARTAKSLALFRDNVAEFKPVWTMQLELGLALVTGLPAGYALWRARRHNEPFDALLFLLSLALVLAAVRGLMFFGVISIAVFQRAALRCRAAGLPFVPGLGPTAQRSLGAIGFAATVLLAGNAVYHRWIRPPLTLGGTQPGLGRSVGGWGEAMTAFLRASPPRGHLMNVGPGVGDLVILDAPGIPVFVDSRLESYPIEFLRAVMRSDGDDGALGALIQRYGVQWIVAEHFREPIRARVVHLLGAGWVPVYVDSDYVVLVRDAPENAAYVAAHRIDLHRAEPDGLVVAPLVLRAQQRGRFARLMHALGADDRAAGQRRAALAEAGPEGAEAFERP